jgi:hypothetical protein
MPAGALSFQRRSRTPPPPAGSVTERSIAPGLGGRRFARQRVRRPNVRKMSARRSMRQPCVILRTIPA